MDTRRNGCDIGSRKKHLFLDISATNNDTLAPLLCQCCETRNIEVFFFYFFLIQFRTSVSTSSRSANASKMDRRNGSHWGPCSGCKANVQEVPT
jgi:hypothetical protein